MSQASTATRPDTDFRGKVRSHDPESSWEAAADQTRTKTQQLREDVHAILSHFGPLTDDEIGSKYADLHAANPERYRQATPQSVRSRRSELETAARVRWTHEKRPSNYGGPSNVWQAL